MEGFVIIVKLHSHVSRTPICFTISENVLEKTHMSKIYLLLYACEYFACMCIGEPPV